MTRSSTVQRLGRLESLKALVMSGEPTTVGEIAAELGVSVRTISRDVSLLRDQGLPIEADRGRGGGVRLHRNWGVGRIKLAYAEAVDLLVSLAVAEQMGSPLFMAHLGRVRRKLMASFSPAMSHKVRGLKARILVGLAASPETLSGFSAPSRGIVERLHQAFLAQDRIAIGYRTEDGRRSARAIQPHYLLLSAPVWYVLAWDELRDDVRTFRCDRITSIRLLEDGFRLLPVERFEGAYEGSDPI